MDIEICLPKDINENMKKMLESQTNTFILNMDSFLKNSDLFRMFEVKSVFVKIDGRNEP